MTVAEFAQLASAFAATFGGSVTSWGRTTARNRRVGGVAGSAHRFFLAVDLIYDRTPDAAEAREAARRLGLKLIREEDHDHLQPLDWPPG